MEKYDEEFLRKLKQLCLEFDSNAGWWPDHDLEGFALYQFAVNPPKEPVNEYTFERMYKGIEYTEEGKKYLKELDKLKE